MKSPIDEMIERTRRRAEDAETPREFGDLPPAARADAGTWKMALITSSQTWTVPSDCDGRLFVEAIGGGGGGGVST